MTTNPLIALGRSAPPPRVVVVGDLHLGPGQDAQTGRYSPTENFLSDRAFGDFLAYHRAHSEAPRLLVLNGDVLDFLRIATHPASEADFAAWHQELTALGRDVPLEDLKTLHRKERRFGLRTTDYKSVWKLRQIASGHRAFFDSLGAWVADDGHILFVTGNHDVELYWPLVQAAIRREIGRGQPGLAAEERVTFAHDHVRLANLYIEHGHRFESITAVQGDPTLPGDEELRLPLGSFVNRYLINHLEGLDPFLDNVRPLDRMLWRMARRHPLRVFRIVWRAVPFIKRAFRPYWMRDAFAFLFLFVSLLVPLVTGVLIALAVAFPESIGAFFKEVFGRFRPYVSALGLVWPYLFGLIREIWPSGLWPKRRRPSVGEDHYAEAVHEALAEEAFDADYSTVYGVLGHTHNPDVQVLPLRHGARVVYLNAGSWIGTWSEDRPDLTGRTVHSFLQFDWTDQGEYIHQHLRWLDGPRRPAPSILLRPEP